MRRREFLAGVAAAAAVASSGPALARDMIVRQGPPRFQLGLAAYSLRQHFAYFRGKSQTPPDGAAPLDMIGFLDYCVAMNVDTAELTSYFFPPEIDDAYLLGIKQAAYLRGVTISGTAIGNNFTTGKGPQLKAEIKAAKLWIDRAAILGAPHIRFFAGTAKDVKEDPVRIDEAIEALAECAEHAAKRGVFLGIENHGGLNAAQMLEIIGRVESPWVGINLDTGNFHSEDPYADLEACVGYAVNVQVKVSMATPQGKKYPADMPRIANILKAANYQGFVILEYEDEAPYENIPQALDTLRQALA